MLVPVTTTLDVQSFQGQQNWIGRLLGPLNSFFTTISIAMNGNITFGDNIPCQTIKMSFTYTAASDFPKVIKWTLPSNTQQNYSANPIELRVCSAMENGVGVAVVPAWSFAN